MRVLYLADVRFPLERANGIQTMQTCHALATRGHTVTLGVRPDTRRPFRDPFTFYGLPASDRLHVVRARVAGPAALRRLAYLGFAWWRAARGPQDVLFTRDLAVADLLLRGLPGRSTVPVVYESHGFAPVVSKTFAQLQSGSTAGSRRKQRRLFNRERRVWERADGYVTITQGLASELADRFEPRPHLAVVPDGVRLSAAGSEEPEANLPPRGSSPGVASSSRARPVIAYAGHFYPWKGVDVLLRAVARLPPAVRLRMVGGHPAELDVARVHALADELGITDRVRFTGLVEPGRVPALLADADVLVLPNVQTKVAARYSSPLKLFEYMAAGRPIVASDLPAIREVLRDGENACLVSPGDPDALAGGVRRVLDDETLGTRIGRMARRDVGAFSWDRRAERLERLFGDLVGPTSCES